MVVAQLVEWSLLTPEIHGLNPVNGKIYIVHWLLSSVPIEMTKKLYRKRGREWPILKKEGWTGLEPPISGVTLPTEPLWPGQRPRTKVVLNPRGLTPPWTSPLLKLV